MEIIPIMSATGRVLAHVDKDEVIANRGHYHLHFSRRGHLRSATRKARASLSPLSHNGESFEQTLSGGIVWALTGVRGSDSTRAR